jgi:CRP-like cAMP-binding protein
MSSVYGYIGLTYIIFHYSDPGDYMATLYFLVSGIGLVVYLLYNRKAVSEPT